MFEKFKEHIEENERQYLKSKKLYNDVFKKEIREDKFKYACHVDKHKFKRIVDESNKKISKEK